MVGRRRVPDIAAGCVTRVRLDSMQWTGIGPSQMRRLLAGDFRLEERDTSSSAAATATGPPPFPLSARASPRLETETVGLGPVAASVALAATLRLTPLIPRQLSRAGASFGVASRFSTTVHYAGPHNSHAQPSLARLARISTDRFNSPISFSRRSASPAARALISACASANCLVVRSMESARSLLLSRAFSS